MARNPIVESPKFGENPLDKYDGPQVAKVKRLTYAVKCLYGLHNWRWKPSPEKYLLNKQNTKQ